MLNYCLRAALAARLQAAAPAAFAQAQSVGIGTTAPQATLCVNGTAHP